VRKLGVVGILLGLLLLVGHVTGNQPNRDARIAASEELGLSFEGRMIKVGDVELHVVFAGPAEGPPVVLLHGFPEFWYAWRGPAAILARAGYRVILPDQRGYNRSEKPSDPAAYRIDHLVADILGLVDALGYERVQLATQDLGGAVGWRLLIDHPERVHKFAVIDASHPLATGAGNEETISWYRTFLQMPFVPGYTARLGNWKLLTSNLRATSAEGAFPEEEMDEFRTAWDRDGAIHSMAAWYRAPAWPPDGDARVANPTLILLAKDDRFIPAERTRNSLPYLDDGRLVELGSGSHWVAGEEPERIGKILVEFFTASDD
jgi:pimeloyl-ACP methyl ester carboxylesterase